MSLRLQITIVILIGLAVSVWVGSLPTKLTPAEQKEQVEENLEPILKLVRWHFIVFERLPANDWMNQERNWELVGIRRPANPYTGEPVRAVDQKSPGDFSVGEVLGRKAVVTYYTTKSGNVQGSFGYIGSSTRRT